MILLGYYSVDSDTELEGCQEEVAAINTRYRSLAEQSEAVFYVDMGRAFTSNIIEYIDTDRIHPAVAGGRAIGQLIAQTINQIQDTVW